MSDVIPFDPQRRRRKRRGGSGGGDDDDGPRKRFEPPILNGRVPPHDLDAEAAVLSAILLTRDALDRVQEVLKPEHFYSDAERAHLRRGARACARRHPHRRRSRWRRTSVIANDLPRLAARPTWPSSLTPRRPSRTLARTRRQSTRSGGSARSSPPANGSPPRAMAMSVRCRRFSTTPSSPSSRSRTSAAGTASNRSAHVLRGAFQQINDAADRGDRVTGIPTGFERLDAKTAGLHAGDVTIVAASPGMGKTSFVCCLAANVASPRHVPTQSDGQWVTPSDPNAPGFGVAIFSMEMPREQLAVRIICCEGRVDVGRSARITLHARRLEAADRRRRRSSPRCRSGSTTPRR